MSSHANDREPAADAEDDDEEAAEPDVPACDTGPAGRARFVLRELRDLLRRRR